MTNSHMTDHNILEKKQGESPKTGQKVQKTSITNSLISVQVGFSSFDVR